MERPRRLVLVRHGESKRNKVKAGNRYFPDEATRALLQGVPDHLIPLTDEGHRQARLTGEHLRRRFGTFDYAYHSGYTRTVETLDGILAAYPPAEREAIQVRAAPFVRERDPGYTFGMTTAEVDAAFPWLAGYWDTFGPFFAQPPGGESLAQVAQRAYLFVNAVFRDRPGRDVLVVSHAGTIRCLRFLPERWTYERMNVFEGTPNCAITHYAFDEPTGRLQLVGCDEVCWRDAGSPTGNP